MSNEELTAEISYSKTLIDRELSKLVKSLEPNLAPQIEYALLSGGKRLRPLMVLFAAQSAGGNRKATVPLALSFELAHTSSLVHDDIIDTDIIRRGKMALHNKWSEKSAVLTGDLLIAYAVYLASSYGGRILKMISQSAIDLCQGEQMDLVLSPISTESEYFQMIESKSSSLFQAAASCGAIVGGASPKETKCLANFGKNFGITYQLRDDLLDLKSGKDQTSQDLKKGRTTLPLIHLYGISNSIERKTIDKDLRVATMKNNIKSDSAIKNILEQLEETGSIIYLKNKIDEHCRLTKTSLAPLKDSIYKNCLLQMTKLLEGR
jgi:geranylgeranyl pyrophosphate synthase